MSNFSRRKLVLTLKPLSLASLLYSLLLGAIPAAFADVPPDCLNATGARLPTNNPQVLNWKKTTPNQYLNRGHVLGTINKVYGRINGHDHFSLKIGPNPTDTLELIYNVEFGALPALRNGMTVESCGDYITSNKKTPQYPASPDLAILHWIHKNPDNKGHAHGWVFIEGKLYGWSLGQ